MKDITIAQVLSYIAANSDKVFTYTLEHLYLVFLPVAMAVVVAVPLGIILSRKQKAAQFVMGIVGMIQTIPSLALLIFMIPFFGLGNKPAIAALFLYSLLPILRNTYAGINGVSKELKEAGKGMGMTDFQLLYLVEMPLALSVIMTGIRTSTVIMIGWAVLAAFIGGGGLGRLIVSGLGMSSMKMVFAGAIPAALLALLVEYLMGYLEKLVVPKGLQKQRG